jgi:hypothetical protein
VGKRMGISYFLVCCVKREQLLCGAGLDHGLLIVHISYALASRPTIVVPFSVTQYGFSLLF